MSQLYTTIAPHYPGGFVSPDQLKLLAEAAERHGGQLKITGNSILLTGIAVEKKDQVLAELGLENNSFSAAAVRSIALCTGKPHCPRAIKDSTALGLALDAAFYGQPTPGKVTIGVSGCPNCCAEVFVKDIGLFALPQGYTLVVGGNAGRHAEAGIIAAKNIPAEEVATIIQRILDIYRANGLPKERLGQCIRRRGRELFIEETIPEQYLP